MEWARDGKLDRNIDRRGRTWSSVVERRRCNVVYSVSASRFAARRRRCEYRIGLALT